MSQDPRGERSYQGGPPWMRGGRGKPPWWPEGEAWPPTRPPWARSRGRFVRRFGFLFVGLVLFTAIVGTIGVWLASTALGVVHAEGHLRVFSLFVLFLAVLGFFGVARGMRRVTRPVGDLVEAAARIQKGDYSVRVNEHGSQEIRSVAQAFNAMTAQLEATEKQRRTFLADVTHELRTPLSIIRGQAEGIADGVYPGDATHMTPIIEATQSLERLVDDLRTLALAETGNLKLNREPVDLGSLIADSVASFQSQAESKGIALRSEPGTGLPSVNADPVRVRAVLANLVGNALAHTPAGGSIVVKAEAGSGIVSVAVRDTGTGIPPELLPRIFDRFVRGSGSAGSGLGLAIAKDIVAAHGGTIAAESPAGQGTTVRFTLPQT
jgi:two-component system sensor histidine kinase BaeS